MRSRFVLSLLTLAIAASGCESATDTSRCGAVPTRVVATSGDTMQTVSGLRYIDLQVGTGEEATACTLLEVGYVGRLENGTQFDAGTFPVYPGSGGAIPGFEQAVVGMRVGGTRRAIIPPYLGYGAAGSPPRIPPNATLIFDLELRGITE